MIATRGLLSAALCLITLSGCALKGRSHLPTGPGSPFPDFAAAYAQATEACKGVNTMTAVLSLSGRAGRTKLRGRIDAGFAAPGQIRLEAPAPFGRPMFVLVANGADATLVFYREGRVLRGEAPESIVEALAGVALAPDVLRNALAGCGFATSDPSEAQSYPGGWLAVQSDDTLTWLRQVQGVWRLMASVRNMLEVRYDGVASGRPTSVRMRSATPAPVDLRIRLSQVEVNVPLQPDAFRVDVPADAAPLTIEELRRAGPLASGTAKPRGL